MNDLSDRIANLSPQKRALLEKRLMKENQADSKEQSITRGDKTSLIPLY